MATKRSTRKSGDAGAHKLAIVAPPYPAPTQPVKVLTPGPVIGTPFAQSPTVPGSPAVMAPYGAQQRQLTMPPADLTKRYGDSGSQRFAGFYFDEYAVEWQNRDRFEIIESMRRGDAQIKAALRAVKSPILATRWDIVPASEEALDVEIAEFCKDTLFGMPLRSWNTFLREVMTCFDFGHSVFEFIWKIKKGKVILYDLAPRLQRSILRWRTSDNKFGIQQIIMTDEAAIALPEIPAEKLFILTNEQEGDDVTGISILRSAWKHWDLKNTFYNIQAMSAERFGVGIPTFSPKDKGGNSAGDFDAATKAELEGIGANIRANESGYIVLPGGVDFEIKVPQGAATTSSQIQEAIDHHGKMIYASVLADFLDLGGAGGNKGGSNALSVDKSSFFIKTLNEFATYIAENIQRQIVRKMVIYAYGKQKAYPTVSFSPIGDIDLANMSTALQGLVVAGLLQPDTDLKKWTRHAFELPDLTPEAEEANREADLEGRLNSIEAGVTKPVPAPAAAVTAPTE